MGNLIRLQIFNRVYKLRHVNFCEWLADAAHLVFAVLQLCFLDLLNQVLQATILAILKHKAHF